MSGTAGRSGCIIVPVDGSAVAEQAIPLALGIARRARSQVQLVMVHQELSPVLIMEPGVVYARTRLAVERSESEYLGNLTSRLRKETGEVLSSTMLKGPLVGTLADYARTSGADLVVMTTHGRGGVGRAWLGSVTDELIRRSEVPVIALRARVNLEPAEEVNIREILVPLDGSPLAEEVLKPVAALARILGAKLSLVQIVQPVMLASDPALSFPLTYDEQLTALQRDAAQDYLRDMAQRLRDEGVEASGVAVLGGATAATILSLAGRARIGLLALATHGRGGIRRLVLGSVADKLVRAAEVPVLVVRPQGEPRAARKEQLVQADADETPEPRAMESAVR
jgi:nucleotide-binding universal stress UspA family protein